MYYYLSLLVAVQGMSALDKKEALLVQLRNMNDEAADGLHTAGGTWRAPFKRAYAVLLLQVLIICIIPISEESISVLKQTRWC